MCSVFEDFVSASFREAVKPSGVELASQYSSTLDVDGTVKIASDRVRVVDGVIRACIDVKYEVEKHRQYPNADLHQIAAHCRQYELGGGVARVYNWRTRRWASGGDQRAHRPMCSA